MNWAIRDCGRASPGGRTKVAVEELVVEVVEVRLVVEGRRPGPAVAAVVRLRPQHGERRPGHAGEQVGVAEEHPAGERQHVRDQHLHRVAVRGLRHARRHAQAQRSGQHRPQQARWQYGNCADSSGCGSAP